MFKKLAIGGLSIFIVGGLLISCSSTNFSNNEEAVQFLVSKVLDLDGMGDNPNGGKMRFSNNGTFTMVSANTKDPTQTYYGKWFFGSCNDCETDYFQKEITIDFNNSGWETNGFNMNGTPVTGYGTHLHGYISKQSNDKWIITFDIDNPQVGFTINNDGSERSSDVAKDFERDLVDK